MNFICAILTKSRCQEKHRHIGKLTANLPSDRAWRGVVLFSPFISDNAYRYE